MVTVRGVKKRVLRLTAQVHPEHRVALPSGGSITVDLRDEGGLQLAVWGGERMQPLALGVWRRLLARHPWDVVVDVGANYGEFSVPASLSGAATVLAVEPNPGVNALLRRSIERNGGSATVTCCLVGSTVGLAGLDVAANSRVGSMSSDRSAGSVVLPVTTLDELASPALPDGGSLLAKIDVEGAEADVIAGARRLMARAGVAVLLVESLHSDRQELEAATAGFDVWGIERSSGRPVGLDAGTAALDGVDVRDLLVTQGLTLDQLHEIVAISPTRPA